MQDAVAAANLLAAPLRRETLSTFGLAAVQSRREWPTRGTQRLQVLIQNRVLLRALRSRSTFRAPLLRDLPGRIVGLGVRPERSDPELFR